MQCVFFSLHSLFKIIFPPLRVQLITPDFRVIYSNANHQHKAKCEEPTHEIQWSEYLKVVEVEIMLEAVSIMQDFFILRQQSEIFHVYTSRIKINFFINAGHIYAERPLSN
jgi:hypothetical protein